MFQKTFGAGDIGFNVGFLVHDSELNPMPDFEKVASFELIHYMVNYDISGSLTKFYS